MSPEGRARGLVAITGANGMIGFACVVRALNEGYRVRCVLRRRSAAKRMSKTPSLRDHTDRIEYAIVPDNRASGAYDAAFEGVQYVIHVAGVWPRPCYHPDDEVYYPFVESMENVLSVAEKAGTVQRVVFTQAGAALVNPDDGDTLGTRMERVLDEHVPICEHSAALRPPLATPHHAYCAAKAYCMTHLNEAKSNLPFSVVQIIPGTVIGPSEMFTGADEAYANMDRMSLALLFNDMRPRYAFGFVHVQDCAAIHVGALDTERLPDESIPDWLVAAASVEQDKTLEQLWEEVGTMIERKFPDQVRDDFFTVGRHKLPINAPYRVNSRWTEARLLGGRKFKNLTDCVEEVAKWYLSLPQEE